MLDGFRSSSGTLKVTFAVFFETKTLMSLLEEMVEGRIIIAGAMERVPTSTTEGVMKNWDHEVNSRSMVTFFGTFLVLGGGGDGFAVETEMEGGTAVEDATEAAFKLGTPKKDAVATAGADSLPSWNLTLFPFLRTLGGAGVPFIATAGAGAGGIAAALTTKEDMSAFLNDCEKTSKRNMRTYGCQIRTHW